MTNLKKHVWILIAITYLVWSATVSADESEPPFENIQPEDLAVLLPIRTWDQKLDSLDQDFIPLAELMSEAVFKKLVAGVVDYPGDGPNSPNEFHPSRNPALAAIRDQSPVGEWFVTGVRFIPCRPYRWPIPAEWIDSIDSDFSQCLSQIRLSAQRFAMVARPGEDGLLTTDDKAIHISYVFVGNEENVAIFKRFLEFDQKMTRDLLAGIKAGISPDEKTLSSSPEDQSRPEFDFIFAKNLVNRHRESINLNPASWNQLVQTVKTSFMKFVNEIKGGSSTGLLKLRSYDELRARNKRILRQLPNLLKKAALPLEITFNFGHTGVNPGLSKVWSLGSFEVIAPELNSLGNDRTTLEKKRLQGAHQISLRSRSRGETYNLHRVLDRGYRETFSDNFGSTSSLDFELKEEINKARHVGDRSIGAIVRELLLVTGNVIYGQPGNEGQDYQVVDQNNGVFYIKREAEQSYGLINDPRIDVPHTSCVSCHIAPSLRLTFRFDPGFPVVTDQRNFDRELKGPAGTGQIDFTSQWLVRALGYQGRIPSLSDRVVREVNFDLESLRASLGPK